MRLVDACWTLALALDLAWGVGWAVGGGRWSWLSVKNVELHLGQQKLSVRFTLVLIQRTEFFRGSGTQPKEKAGAKGQSFLLTNALE